MGVLFRARHLSLQIFYYVRFEIVIKRLHSLYLLSFDYESVFINIFIANMLEREFDSDNINLCSFVSFS